jgi:hypothetical protein
MAAIAGIAVGVVLLLPAATEENSMLVETIILAAVFFALYAVFLVWYGGRGKPLSQAEVDALLLEMKRRVGK